MVFALLGVAVWYLAANTSRNLSARHMVTGFAFLHQTSRIPISESMISTVPGVDTYARVLLVGLLNTIKISVVAIALASVLGLLIGLGRLSTNMLLSGLCRCYIGFYRNVPLLVHLVFWYQILDRLPGPRQAFLPLPGVVLSNRGLRLPWIDWATLTPSWPVLQGFDYHGGTLLSIEYVALLVGLVTYTAAYIAETVRGGVLAVGTGQWEAARALGLRTPAILRRVILPQALRVVIPPLTGEYLGIIKNSSLAVAIGYQEIVSISDSVLTETGQAVEGIAIVMAVFLAISLAVSFSMRWFDARVQFSD